MTKKIDPDVKAMTVGQLRREVMRLRNAFLVEANHTGDRRCWINLLRGTLAGRTIQPLSFPRKVFLSY